MPVTLYRPPGFPKVTDNLGGDSVLLDRQQHTSDTTTTLADFRSALPAAGSTHPDLAGVFLVNREISRQEGAPGFWYADLRYESTAALVGSPSGYRTDGQEEYSMDDGGVEKPLESKDNYRTRWNYHLACATNGASTPSWYAGATNILINAPDDTAFKWIRDGNEAPVKADGTYWTIIAPKTKPGVESWVSPAPVINWKKYFYGEANASAFVAAHVVGNRETPGKTFGLAGDFLVLNVNLEPSGRYWVGVVKYQNNRSGWDTDLYPT